MVEMEHLTIEKLVLVDQFVLVSMNVKGVRGEGEGEFTRYFQSTYDDRFEPC